MKHRTVAALAACVGVLILVGSAFGGASIRTAPAAQTLANSTKGEWILFNLNSRGSTEETFVRFGHPLSFGEAKCLSFYYRATLQPVFFALRVGHKPVRVAVLDSPVLPPVPLKSTKLRGSPIGDALFGAAEACSIPLEDWL